MPDFGFIQGAWNKDKLHRAVDALPDDACALLLTDSCLHDYDDESAHAPEDCENKIGNVADWRFIGPLTTRNAVGLLEFAKLAIFGRQWDDEVNDA